MNPAKSHVKTIVTEELGRHIEEMCEKASERVHVHSGGKEAFKLGAQRVGELAEHIDKDIQEGVIDEFVGEPLKVASYAKRYLKRAVGALDNLATAAEIAVHVANGRVIGLKDSAEYVGGVWKEEKAKLDAYAEAISEGKDEIDGRSLDGHPGLSLKSQRLDEEAEKPKEPEPPKELLKKAKPKIPKPQTKAAVRARPKVDGKR